MKTVGIKRREAHFRSLNFLAPVVAYCLAIFEGRELSDPKAGRPSSTERKKYLKKMSASLHEFSSILVVH